ncbi:putative reverse transcriptase domain-containing protein [Tanacetum coccineum]
MVRGETKTRMRDRCIELLCEDVGTADYPAFDGSMMGEVDINTLTMEQYLALTCGNQAPGVLKPELGGNVNFEIKSQFKRELREDTFSRNKIMLRVFPITLIRAAKRWVERVPPGTINTWDLLKQAFIQRYCPPSKTAKQLEEIHNFKQESNETLYQAWKSRKASNGSSNGIAAIANKLDSLWRDMKKLKENVHAI